MVTQMALIIAHDNNLKLSNTIGYYTDRNNVLKMKGGGGCIGNRIRTKNPNRSNHLRENVNLTMQTLTRSHSCFLIYGL